MFVGEYGWGGSLSSTAQEPRTRAFVRSLLNWGAPFALFWEIYNNEAGKSFWLIDSSGRRTPCYDFHQRFANRARLEVATFRQDQARVPNEAEFSALMALVLSAVLPEPVPVTIVNGFAVQSGIDSARVEGVVEQGLYGDEAARVWLYWGRVDGDVNPAAWEHSVDLGVNQRFGPSTVSAALSGLDSKGTYFYRLQAVQAARESWASHSDSFQMGRSIPSIRATIEGDGRFVLRWEDGVGPLPVGPLWLQSTDRVEQPVQWMTLLSTNSTGLPVTLEIPGASSFGRRYFRVLIGP